MSQANVVRYTSRSITPTPKRKSRSRSTSRTRTNSRSRSPGSTNAWNPGNNLYVTGLSTRVSSSDLENFFSKRGKVQECRIVTDPRTRESRGFAFVTMETVADADQCIKYLDRSVLEGRLITIEKAKRKRGRTPPQHFLRMSQANEVRYTSRSITPTPRRKSRSRSTSRSRARNQSRSPSYADARNPGNNLYITGLSSRVSNSELESFFSKRGKVQECQIVIDPHTRESRGFAFVTMETVEDADRCIQYFDRSVLEGRLITVEKAKRKRGRTPTPGKYRGEREKRGHDRRRSRSHSPRRPRDRGRSHSRGREERSHSKRDERRCRSKSSSPTSNGNHASG